MKLLDKYHLGPHTWESRWFRDLRTARWCARCGTTEIGIGSGWHRLRGRGSRIPNMPPQELMDSDDIEARLAWYKENPDEV